MADLFDDTDAAPDRDRGARTADGAAGPRPLADRLRPASLEEVIGQDHLLGPDGSLSGMIARGTLPSLVLWGPPGVGKTTIARLLAEAAEMSFVQISAIFTGVADLRKVFDAATLRHRQGRATLLFVDEIHRFNKAQQDSFLPHMESGSIVLVGATTENPSFELNAALLSRAQVLVLHRLDEAALSELLDRAETASGRTLPLDDTARDLLIRYADGDGRALLNLAEQALSWGDDVQDAETVSRRLQRTAPKHDKSGEGHYNLISALHKSVRGSDVDAALYWLGRMLDAGEDPRYLARRITRMAVEDIGLADPWAEQKCLAAWQTYERLGSPEGELALANAVGYLALAPKSNAIYAAFKEVRGEIRQSGALPPPKHILNAPTKLMKSQGYGQGYVYDHDEPGAVADQAYLPDDIAERRFYRPTDRGREEHYRQRLRQIAELRAANAQGDGSDTQ